MLVFGNGWARGNMSSSKCSWLALPICWGLIIQGMAAHCSKMRILTAILATIGTESVMYELAFYHHFPDASTICFRYGSAIGSWTSSAGPLLFRSSTYSDFKLEPAEAAEHAEALLYVDVFRAASGTECGEEGWISSSPSLINGARRSPLASSSSNTFGYAFKASGSSVTPGLDTSRAADAAGKPQEVEASKFNLIFWNSASGLDGCVAEIRFSNKTRWVVGPISIGMGKEVTVGCSEFDWSIASFVFECSGRTYAYASRTDGQGALFCTGASQQVSLVGMSGSDDSLAPSVVVLSGTRQCPCYKSCTWICINEAARWSRFGVIHFVMLSSFLFSLRDRCQYI